MKSYLIYKLGEDYRFSEQIDAGRKGRKYSLKGLTGRILHEFLYNDVYIEIDYKSMDESEHMELEKILKDIHHKIINKMPLRMNEDYT